MLTNKLLTVECFFSTYQLIAQKANKLFLCLSKIYLSFFIFELLIETNQ